MENHHAFLLFAPSLEEASLPQYCMNQSVDVQHLVRDRFSIDDARELSLQAQQTPIASPYRTFVISAGEIAVEAQNALLKLFEEPPRHARFYVVIPQTAHLLPTLQSRLMVKEGVQNAKESELFIAFLHMGLSERLELLALKTKAKDAAWVEAIVQGCEKFSLERKDEALMGTVLFVRRYLKTRGASAKMLLEELSLQLPLR
jgi:hypothetical protein